MEFGSFDWFVEEVRTNCPPGSIRIITSLYSLYTISVCVARLICTLGNEYFHRNAERPDTVTELNNLLTPLINLIIPLYTAL
jgi:hypothetical protein